MEDVKKVYDFLENAKTFYLATVEGDQPRVRPYGQCSISKAKSTSWLLVRPNATRQIAANCKDEICAFKENLRIECKLWRTTVQRWARHSWIRCLC